MSSTSRFSHTVENYLRYRPGYPPQLLEFMKTELGLGANSVIADIGSGTGKLTELLLQNGHPVLAVEPNGPMRQAAEKLLGHFPHLSSVEGTAEHTQLPANSAGFITAAQAFHWFDRAAARREFLRIGQPNAWTLLIWNDRADDRSAFMRAYNQFLHDYSTDLASIDHRNMGAAQFDEFFGTGNWRAWRCDYLQRFDFDGVKGRYLSCSYALTEPDHRLAEALQRLKSIFDNHSEGGCVEFWYETQVFFGQLTAIK